MLALLLVSAGKFLDLARAYDWMAVEAVLKNEPTLVNVQPGERWSALHQACHAGDAAMVEWLLAHGADKDKCNGAGQTAAAVASCSACVALLTTSQKTAPAGAEMHAVTPSCTHSSSGWRTTWRAAARRRWP